MAEPSATVAKPDELIASATEYWMKARLDAPLAATDRIDSNAKQLIALATAVLTVLSAVIKIAKVSDQVLLGFAATAFMFLFVSVVFAAYTIYVQTDYVRTSSILELLKEPRGEGMLTVLGVQINDMCSQVDRVLRRKRKLLGWGMFAFCGSLLSSLGCLVTILIRAG